MGKKLGFLAFSNTLASIITLNIILAPVLMVANFVPHPLQLEAYAQEDEQPNQMLNDLGGGGILETPREYTGTEEEVSGLDTEGCYNEEVSAQSQDFLNGILRGEGIDPSWYCPEEIPEGASPEQVKEMLRMEHCKNMGMAGVVGEVVQPSEYKQYNAYCRQWFPYP